MPAALAGRLRRNDGAMSIRVTIRHQLGALALNASFESNGRLTAIFGPSGSGKTSIINVMAGLIKPDFARIDLDGHILEDSGNGISLPPHKRRVGYVFQDARLFPHLTVEQNLAFGRWFTPKAGRYADGGQIVSLLGIKHLLQRKPFQLSGGEKQRVAIGRALLASPKLLLMDEPLASLDQARKNEIIPYIERLRDELQVPIIYVSHSLAEVSRLATEVVVLAQGKLTAFGTPSEIIQRQDILPPDERDEGGVVLDMEVLGHDQAYDLTTLRGEAGEARITGHVGAPGTKARIRFRARDVMLATSRPDNISALNIFEGIVQKIDTKGDAFSTVTVNCNGEMLIARITRYSAETLALAPGCKVFGVAKAVSLASGAAAPAPRG